MKKKVLCVFSLLLYVVVACTMLSEKIEVEMQTQAEVWTVKASSSSFELKLSTGYLFRENNMDHLFEIKEGTGWESGLRAEEIASEYWQIDYTSEVPMVKLNSFNDYTFIRTASRVPETGELVEIIEESEIAPDSWLVYYPNGVPEHEKLPSEMELIAQSSDALLLRVERSKYPFFEHRAIGDDLKQIAESDMRIFSLTTVEAFLKQIPSLALVLLLLVIPVVLWAFSCFLSVDAGKNKVTIAVNILLAAVSLFCLRSVLNHIDLPAALLPDVNILNWQHYKCEFSLIFAKLGDLGKAAQSQLILKDEIIGKTYGILASGLAGVTFVLVSESLINLLSRRRKCGNA